MNLGREQYKKTHTKQQNPSTTTMVIDIKVPAVGESVTEVTLASWMVEEGDYVEMDQPICELESDKATMELPAEKAGTVKFVAQEGDELVIGSMICTIDTSATAPAAKAETPQKETPQKEVAKSAAPEKPATIQESHATGHPSPAAGKILRENEINPQSVSGSGRNGRITKEDAQSAVSNKKVSSPAPKSEPTKTHIAPAVVGERNTRREKMSRLRRTIASHLVNSKNGTAMLTTFNEVDMTSILELRGQYKEKYKERYGVSLGFMGFFMKACATALMEMPDVNAQLDENEIVYHDFVDISVAVSTPKGLVTPVLRNVEGLDLFQIEAGVKALALKGRDNKLTIDEMSGGTFTVSNGGVFGSLNSTPIINAPQSAILGMHKIQERPVVLNGEIVARPMMYLALSYDHRIIDGKGAVTFLVRVKDLLEDPVRLMLKI